LWLEASPRKIVRETPYLEKNPSQKRTDRAAQVVECLPSKHEALNSNPSPIHTQKKKSVKTSRDLTSGLLDQKSEVIFT
jgi:hypothetical protein